MGLAGAAEEQAQVVVDLGDRAHGGARVLAGGLLLDRDRRRKPLEQVHVRLVHLPEELAGVGGQRLHVAALPLGVEGVKGQGGLARAGQAGEDDEFVAGQVNRDVLQVVHARAPDAQELRLHGCEQGFLERGVGGAAAGRPRGNDKHAGPAGQKKGSRAAAARDPTKKPGKRACRVYELAPREGLEPPTRWLTATCSTN